MSDYIHNLPVEQNTLTDHEKKMLDLLAEDKHRVQQIISEMKLPIIAGVLFAALHSSFMTNFLHTTVPYTRTSEMSTIVVKTLIFMVILYCVMNISIIMKSD